jgi:hypothetical protein
LAKQRPRPGIYETRKGSDEGRRREQRQAEKGRRKRTEKKGRVGRKKKKRRKEKGEKKEEKEGRKRKASRAKCVPRRSERDCRSTMPHCLRVPGRDGGAIVVEAGVGKEQERGSI